MKQTWSFSLLIYSNIHCFLNKGMCSLFITTPFHPIQVPPRMIIVDLCWNITNLEQILNLMIITKFLSILSGGPKSVDWTQRRYDTKGATQYSIQALCHKFFFLFLQSWSSSIQTQKEIIKKKFFSSFLIHFHRPLVIRKYGHTLVHWSCHSHISLISTYIHTFNLTGISFCCDLS